MPAATLADRTDPHRRFVGVGLQLSAFRIAGGESILPEVEGKTPGEQAVTLVEQTCDQPFAVRQVGRFSGHSESAELNIPEARGAVRPRLLKPRQDIAADVRPYLTGHMLRFHRILSAIAQTKAHASGLAIEGIETYTFRDPEENTTKLILRVEVKANAAQAMAYWDALGRGVDTWRDGLPDYLRQMLVGRWSFRVQWSPNGST